jgi:hypothetical protein
VPPSPPPHPPSTPFPPAGGGPEPTSPTGPLRVILLGPPRVESPSGEPIGLSSGKPLALLAYLATTGEPVRREALADLLWGNAPRERARASLRQALWTLRKAVGAEHVVGDEWIGVDRTRVDVDVDALIEAVSRGDLARVRTLWTGTPLDGLDVADAPEWERWAEAFRRDLEERVGTACWTEGRRRRGSAQERAGAELLAFARDLLPDRVQVHVDTLEALLDLRAVGEAEAALRVAEARLEDEPARGRLQHLRERLDLLRTGGAGNPAAPALGSALVGRDGEVRTLLRKWRQAVQGSSGVGLLLGPTGIGKTRLAEEVQRVAEAEGARIVALKAEDSERPIEWGVLAELIQQLLRLSGATGISPASDAVLRSLIPSQALGPMPSPDDPAARGAAATALRARPSAALADAVADLVTAVSEDAPLLLLLDDLHWADTESRTVLVRVATRLASAPVLLLLTSRTDVEEPRIRKTLALLAEAPSAVSIELAPLSLAETEALFRADLRFEPDQEASGLLTRIHRTTRGNPLFLLELFKLFEGEGIITVDPRGSRILHTDRLPPEIPLPESVRALVARQLDQLSSDAALVAAHLARVGHPATPRLLGLQTGLGASGVTNGIGELLQRRMIRWDRGEALTFAHDELRAAVASRYQLHVGLTTGGGTQWSLFRSMVAATLAIFVLGGVILFSNQGTGLGRAPHGGGVVITQAPDGTESAFRLDGTFGDIPRSVSGGMGVSPPQVVLRPSPLGGVDLHLALADGTESPRFANHATAPTLIRVSSDLSHVAWVEAGVPDRVLVAPLGGGPVATDARFQILDLTWCGRGRLVLLANSGSGVEALQWTPGSGSPTAIPLRGVRPGQSLACAPDERALVFVGARSGELGLFLHDLATGSTDALDLPGSPDLAHVRWNLPTARSIPVSLRITPDPPLVLGIGGQRALRAQIVNSDGTLRGTALEWRSTDPDIATVSPSGVLSGIRPGSVRILAIGAGWLTGAVDVEVRSEIEAAPRLRALSTPPDTLESAPAWNGTLSGAWFPRSRPYALRLEEGDGVLEERLTLDARGGVTLEVELRVFMGPMGEGDEGEGEPSLLPMVEVCLSPEGGRAEGCLRHPASSPPRWTRTDIAVHSGGAFPPVILPLPTPRPPSGWVRAALTVSPSGEVALFVDERRLGIAPLKITGLSAGTWTLRIAAQAGAGDLEVRRVRVWEGVRYQAPE